MELRVPEPFSRVSSSRLLTIKDLTGCINKLRQVNVIASNLIETFQHLLLKKESNKTNS